MAAKGTKRGPKAKTISKSPSVFELDLQDLGRLIADPPSSDTDLIVDRVAEKGYRFYIHTPFGYRGVKKVWVEFDGDLGLTAELGEPN